MTDIARRAGVDYSDFNRCEGESLKIASRNLYTSPLSYALRRPLRTKKAASSGTEVTGFALAGSADRPELTSSALVFNPQRSLVYWS